GDLEKGLKKVYRAIDTRSVMPILSGIKIEAEGNKLTLTASNNTLTIQTIVKDVEVEVDGGIVLPAKEIVGLVSAMNEGDVFINVENNQAFIKNNKSSVKLNGMDANEYPKVNKDDHSNIFSMTSDVLKDVIGKTVFAVSRIESRPILMGVNFTKKENELVLTATDSRRLARLEVEVEELEEFEGFTLPARSLKSIVTLFEKEESLNILQSNNNVAIESDDTKVLIRLMSGSYPDTERLIPEGGNTILTGNTDGFISSLERASILAKDELVVTFVMTDVQNGIFNTILLKQKSTEVGVSEEEIIVEDIEGVELEISFNVNYVLDALKALDDEVVKFEFGGHLRPFTVMNVNDTSETQLNLPVKTF